MREMVKMVVVLTVLSLISGGSLAYLRDKTKDRIELQQLQFVKGPAIQSILKDASNNPIMDRFKIMDGTIERTFFVGVIGGKPHAVAFEAAGKGFGGTLGLMVGVDVDTDQIIGVGVTAHSETPGLGSRAKTDPAFTGQFVAKPLTQTFQVKTDGGQVDALSGATVTSRGVAGGVTAAGLLYKEFKPQIIEKLKAFNK